MVKGKGKRWIAYYRCSTERQGRSGLGLDAQRKLVKEFCGDDWPPVAEYTEIESGKNNDRPQLALALAQCRKLGASLVIAKLDRLGRRMSFIAGLMDADVPFFAADMPHADRFRLHLEAAIAEDERRRISERTIAALQAAKARGTKLGGFKGYSITAKQAAAGRRKASQERTARAAQDAAAVLPAITRIQQQHGITSASGIAKALNDQGITTPRGGQWQAVQVQRMLARVA